MRFVKRLDPLPIFDGVPCSAVAVGTALGIERETDIRLPAGLKSDGYLSLANMDSYLRQSLTVSRRCSFSRGQRPLLLDFLRQNTERCIICVLGHYLYADGRTYWSFLRNGKDPVVSVWYLKEVNS